MQVGVVQGGPGAVNQHQASVLYGGELGPVLLKIYNVGNGVILISTDQIALQNGSAGYPLEPGKTWEQQYPANVRLFAISPNAGGGSVDVEAIPVPAPATSIAVTAADRIKGYLSRPIASFFLLLFLASFAHAQFAPSSFRTINLGVNVIGTGVLSSGNNTFAFNVAPNVAKLTFIVENTEPNNTHFVSMNFGAFFYNPGSSTTDFGGYPVLGVQATLPTKCDYGNVSPSNISGGMLSGNGGEVGFTCEAPSSLQGILVVNMDFASQATWVYVIGSSVAFNGPAVDSGALSQCGQSQSFGQGPQGIGENGRTFIACSPADLHLLNATLPASGSTALSNNIDMRGVQKATLWSNCTQSYSVNIQTLAEDGATPLLWGQVASPVPANTWTPTYFSIFKATSSGAPVTGGEFELPQRALSFSFSNGGSTAGTCTARLFLAY